MTYHNRNGLGAVAAGPLPIGTRLVAGYRVTGLPSAQAGAAPAALSAAMSAGFRGRTLGTGWGPAHGVPSGHLWALVEIAAQGITGEQMNSIFANVGRALQSRLAGTTVANTHAHFEGGGAAPGGAAPSGGGKVPGSEYMPGLDTMFPGPTTYPTNPYDPYANSMLPPADTIGGLPIWAVVVGGVAIVGAAAAVLMRKPAVKANRRRGGRRTNWSPMAANRRRRAARR